ncbi:hypothetical protein L596_008212 [Steinernema carpocapsae]|uniref:Uncharacterized protein n=1 Tax=Steinernema carpocapsae TaxID=34508 RepID=A0A4U5PBW2_STECR|nr:hypothetical protein L596_008212 [Steinernema carpocapsae]
MKLAQRAISAETSCFTAAKRNADWGVVGSSFTAFQLRSWSLTPPINGLATASIDSIWRRIIRFVDRVITGFVVVQKYQHIGQVLAIKFPPIQYPSPKSQALRVETCPPSKLTSSAGFAGEGA